MGISRERGRAAPSLPLHFSFRPLVSSSLHSLPFTTMPTHHHDLSLQQLSAASLALSGDAAKARRAAEAAKADAVAAAGRE